MDTNEKFKKLENKIWITRKSRINAAERIKNIDDCGNFILMLYSVTLLVGSVLNLMACSEAMNLMLTLISVVVSSLVLYINSQNFKERYFALKQNYIELDMIEYRAKNCKNDEEYEDIYKDYNKALANVENHSTSDYLETLYNDKDSKMSPENYFNLIWYKIKFWITMAVSIIPLVYTWMDCIKVYISYVNNIK